MLKKLHLFKLGLLGFLCLGALSLAACQHENESENEPQQRTGNGHLVVSYGGTVLYNEQILDLGISLVNMPTELIFDVQNVGTETIAFTGNPTVRITNGSDMYQGFQVSQELPKGLPPKAKTQFIILYTPTMAGESNCSVDIYTNEKGARQISIGLHALARLHAPEIGVTLTQQVMDGNIDNNSFAMTKGMTQRLGQVEVGKSIDLTFAIANNGTSELTIGDDLEGVTLGSNPAYQLIQDAGEKVLSPGASTDFKVRFAPKTVGSHATSITIESDDKENSPFSFSLLGSSYKGVVQDLPEITVSVNGYNIADGTSGLLLGSELVNSTLKVDIGIKNEGTADLLLGNSVQSPISLSENEGCFAIAAQPSSTTLPPNRQNQTTAAINFTPARVGRCCTKVTITNNDSDEANFTFTMCGDGYEKSTAAEITGYTVELHQNVGKESHKVITYTFATDLTMGTYVIFAREVADLAAWSALFSPILTAEQLEKVSLYWQTSDPENGDTWQSNGNDDVVIIKDKDGKIIDKSAVSENAIKVRDQATIENETLDAATEFDGNEGHYLLGLTTKGAIGAPDPLLNADGQGKYSEPIYIYEIGERGKNNSLGGTTQLTNTKGNYVIFYLPENK